MILLSIRCLLIHLAVVKAMVVENASATRRAFLSGIALSTVVAATSLEAADADSFTSSSFQRIPTQFIAALGDPASNHGENAQQWGIWKVDPGPRGVFLSDYKKQLSDGVGPYGWKYDKNDWWLEEHGLIMESPDFPLSAGRFLVTGGRETTSVLTVDNQGKWELDNGTLYDVTHLPCRSARYTSSVATSTNSGACTPTKANPANFPVKPGASMPGVLGCSKHDYAVLFVIGMGKDPIY